MFFIVQGALAEYALTARGDHPTPCFPLHIDAISEGARLWWAWREEWKALSPNVFALVGAGFVFFWGDSRRRAQVFRAEWDDFTQRGSTRGQPHWHIDDKILAEASWIPAPKQLPHSSVAEFDIIEVDRTTEIQDYEAIETMSAEPEVSFVSLSGMHLYMGGWTHNSKKPPRCWQPRLDLNELKSWATSTLDYVQREAGEVQEEL